MDRTIPIKIKSWEILISQINYNKKIPDLFKKYKLKETNKSIHILFSQEQAVRNFIFHNKDKICRLHGEIPDIVIERKLSRDEFLKIESESRFYYMGVGEKGNLYQLIPLTDKIREISLETDEGEVVAGPAVTNLLGDWWDGFWRDMSRVDVEGGVLMEESKKPERLIYRIFDMITQPNDLVMDSFLGSGTTASVAQKMKLRWIGVEMGQHAESLTIPRLMNVITGKDKTGISLITRWRGGGGFKYYQLGESLISEQDMNWTLKAEEMAEAVFLHFQYRPTESDWLKKENMYLGKHQSAHYHFAISFASREVKTLTADLYEKNVAELEKEKFKHLTIFTNVAISVSPESLDDRVMVKKIPAAILREYNLL